MRLLGRYLVVAVSLLFFGSLPASVGAEDTESTGTLIVKVQGLKSSDGNLRFTLFNSEENYLKQPVHADVVEIKDQQGTWTVENLAYVSYAVLVHHDVNSSGTMERYWFGKPKEPTGASNHVPPRFRPPKFEKAKFLFESPTMILAISVK